MPAKKNADVDVVQAAYEAAVKNLVDVYFTNCIDGDSDPDGKFLRGLGVIRKARDQVIELVNR